MKDRPRIYNQSVHKHYQNPHNKGTLKDPDLSVTEGNPKCGDRITLELKIRGNEISNIKFDGYGCVLSIGAASILTQLVRGLTVQEASELTLEDLKNNMGNPTKMREDCASLSLRALKKALSQ